MSRDNAVATDLDTMTVEEPPVRTARIPAKNEKSRNWAKLLPRTPAEIVLVALVAFVICTQLAYLLRVSTAIPHQDDWNFLDKMFRAVERHQVAAWIFDSPNGHFVVPGALAYFVSWRYFSLDLSIVRLLNFPICLTAFFLIARLIKAHFKRRFLRLYLFAGASFLIFNLSFWEHFAQAGGFSAMLSVLFGGVGVYYIAKALRLSSPWKSYPFLIGLLWLFASVLSLGGGYAAVAAAVLLALSSILRKSEVSKRVPRYNITVVGLICALGVLAVVSHPAFNLNSRLVSAAYHSVLVAGSVGSAFLDKNTVLAQNVAFACGMLLLFIALFIAFQLLKKQPSQQRLLPEFSMGLVLFGFFGCLAVAIARAYLPDSEFLSARYTPYPSIILLGSLLYFACSRLFFLTHIWCLAASVYVLATAKESQMGFFRAKLYNKITVAVQAADTLSDEDLRASLYWRENTKGVRKVIMRMRSERSNVFRIKGDQ
jgi:hypothetical protein